jgi:long-chain fatty acid transport protein
MQSLVKKSVIAAALLGTTPAYAGGLWLTEFNQPTQGRAGAGEEAGTGDATDAFFNPAAMSRHTESQLTVAGGLILPQVEFDVEQGSLINGTGDGGDAGSLTPSASAFYTRPLNEKWSMGIGGLALTGSALDYDDDWVGRFEAQDVSIIVIGLVPSLAYKVTDKFSVGFALPVMYSNLELDIAVPNILSPGEDEGKGELDGDDIQVAPSLSFHYQITDRTAIGGRASSKFEFDYDGDLDSRYLGQVGVNTELTLAALAKVGISHYFSSKWSGYATFGWEDWSEMDEVLLSTSGGGNGAVLPRDWHDTYHSALGVDYRLDEQWTLRAGISHDTSPTNDVDRTADMPIDEQFRYAIGADYLRNNGMKISGSLVYADYGDAEIDNTRTRPLLGYKGKYDTNQIWFAAVSVNWPLGGGSRN